MDIETGRHGSLDLVEELAKLRCPVAAIAFADDASGGNVEGGKQRSGAMAGIVMTASGGLAGAFVVPAMWINYMNLRVSLRLALIDTGFWLVAYLSIGLTFFLLAR